jgi:hypothetical protein
LRHLVEGLREICRITVALRRSCSTLSSNEAGPRLPELSTLVPRIKTHQFTAALRGMDVSTDQLPYTEPLAADLLVAGGS